MGRNPLTALALVGLFCGHGAVCHRAGEAAELVLPQERQAYYSDEAIKLAVVGLAKDAGASLELTPQGGSSSPVTIAVKGDGSTVAVVLPPGSLAPGKYTLKLDGKDGPALTIASGVRDSTFLTSQTIAANDLRAAGGNFIVGNAASFGKLNPAGLPLTKGLRAQRSGGMNAIEQGVAMDLPTLIYMYWTGYVLHKPFGSEKSWAEAKMNEAMRLLSFHTAQRLRRFGKNILSIGTIDEPGLSWGKTPAGGMASGFPNWDEQPWYEQRGWKYTDDPASRSDDDFLKYMAIRCAILKENQAQAAKDLKAVWKETVFSTDLYAPHAVMDGTDPLNQEINDIPSSHVFVDWGIDRLGAYSGVMLEKAHDPTSKLAHAMNGQLFGVVVPQPAQLHAYRACMNGMLAAGLESNWWLNTQGMKNEHLAAVNNPAKRVGPVLRHMQPSEHDAAVLWSFTEISMREKDITAKEAAKKTGQQIKLMIASLPENSALKQGKEIDINAYSIGGDYKETVLTAHYALARAGYPAHILDERRLSNLKKYKTLVIAGQTFALPAEARQAIADFTAGGGKIVVDQSTTVSFDGAIVADVNLKGLSHRWSVLYTQFEQNPKSFQSIREGSSFLTNHFMDEPVRKAVAPLKAALAKTAAQPRLETNADELLAERHVGGEGQLYMVINGHEQLPQIADDAKHAIYNYAPLSAAFSLKGLPEACSVYVLEGGDFSKAGKLADPRAAIQGSFEPGEMKLYLVAPRDPAGLDVSATAAGAEIEVSAKLKGLKMPWPLLVTFKDPAGKTLFEVHRATGADGSYTERFPIGMNAAAGAYTVAVMSPLANLSGQAQAAHNPAAAAPQVVSESVQVMDRATIAAFLKTKPEIVIAIGKDAHRAAADKLAAALSARGVKASVKPEAEVLKKARYPRVWNPYAKLYRATGDEQPAGDKKIDARIELATDAGGVITAKTSDGKDVSQDWKLPNSLVTIGGVGFTDFSGDAELCYEPGVKLYIDANRGVTVLKGQLEEEKTTDEFIAKWSKPWSRLTSHVGGYQLPPQLPEAYTAAAHIILLGDSTTSEAVAALQASDLLLEVVDELYPGPGKSLVSFAWSPFAVEKNVILIGASDDAGLAAGVNKLLEISQ